MAISMAELSVIIFTICMYSINYNYSDDGTKIMSITLTQYLNCNCSQFGHFDYSQESSQPYGSSAPYYTPGQAAYSGSILTPDVTASYSQPSSENFDDEPPLLEGKASLIVHVYMRHHLL